MAKSVLVNPRRSGVRVAPVLGFQTGSPPTISSINYSQGQIEGGGASIVIAGTNFTGATSVTFLGTASVYVVDSAIQITATLPAHVAGSGNVQVTTPFGSATIAFEYWTPAQLSLTGWWRANSNTGYTVSGGFATMLACISAGASGANGSLDQPTAALQPAVGAALNGHNPPDADGVNDYLQNLNSLGTFITASDFTMDTLFFADTAGADAGPANRWNNRGIFEDIAGWAGMTHSVNGAHCFAYGTGAELTIACGTGAWHAFQATFTSHIIRGRVDGGAFSSSADTVSNVGSVANSMSVFSRNGSNLFDGKIAEIIVTNTVLSDANLTKILNYKRQRYGLAL